MTEFTNTCDDDRSSAAVFTDEDGSSYENYVTQTS
jgi:hypothetical protein